MKSEEEESGERVSVVDDASRLVFFPPAFAHPQPICILDSVDRDPLAFVAGRGSRRNATLVTTPTTNERDFFY